MQSEDPDDAAFERTPLLRQSNNGLQAERSVVSYGSEPRDAEGSTETPAGDVEATDERDTEDKQLPALEILLIMSSTWIGVFLASLDISIMISLMGPISSSFDAFAIFTWLILAYNITSAAIQPLSGKLTDILGRRLGLILANIPFLLGTLACGLAKEAWVFILGRAITGLGGGAIIPISMFLLSDLVPLRSRGLWFGVSEIVFGAGYSLGGLFGGWITHIWSWRWAFLVQIPLIFLSIFFVFFKLPKNLMKPSERSTIKRIDFLGSITLIFAIILFLIGTTVGGNIVPWTHPIVYITLVISAVMFVGFYYIERHIALEPVIPVTLLADRSIIATCLTIVLQSMAAFTSIYYLTLFLQVQGLSEAESGLRLVGQAAGLIPGSVGTGFILQVTGRYYYLCFACQILMIIGASLFLGLVNLSMANWLPFLLHFILGTGFNGAQNITRIALISSVDHAHHAAITSVSYTFRSLGNVLGLTVASAIFQNILRTKLWAKLGNVKNAADLISHLRADIKQLDHLSGTIKSKALDAYMDTFRGIWLYMLILLVLSAACSLLIKEHTLHKTISRT